MVGAPGSRLVQAAGPAGLHGQESSPARVTLEEAIERALVHTPTAVGARVGTGNASAGLLQARGSFLPTVNLSSNFTNSSNERFDQNTGRLVSESYSAQLSANDDLG